MFLMNAISPNNSGVKAIQREIVFILTHKYKASQFILFNSGTVDNDAIMCVWFNYIEACCCFLDGITKIVFLAEHRRTKAKIT